MKSTRSLASMKKKDDTYLVKRRGHMCVRSKIKKKLNTRQK